MINRYTLIASTILLLTSCQKDEINNYSFDSALEQEYSLESSETNEQTSTTLNYGLYWIDKNQNNKKAYNTNTNKKISVNSSYYNDGKPTVIYFHGWQPNVYKEGYQERSFNMKDDSGKNVNTIATWKSKGWNVAVFYWDQFADESELKNAEAKIWSTKGGKKMRYRKSDGQYSTIGSPTKSISDLAVQQIQELLKNNSSNNLRIIGHSLGSQLATAVSYKLNKSISEGKLSNNLKVSRLELLDPFWSKGSKSFIGNKWTGELTRNYIKEMINRDKLAATWYRSSVIMDVGIGDSNKNLESLVALQNQRMWFLNGLNIVAKHVDVVNHYFWSYSFSEPKEVTLNFWKQRKTTGKKTASAKTSTSRIREMMGSKYQWDQVEGRYTRTPNDDQFERKNG